MQKFILLSLLCLLVFGCANPAAIKEEAKKEIIQMQNQEAETLKSLVQNFYDQLSTTPDTKTASKAASYMAKDWKSTPTPQGGPDLEGFVKTLHMFHGMIPDLKWEVKEMLVSGNQVIVRSTASGTPNSPEGYFFGVPTKGEKSFEVQTIDIHSIVDGKMVKSYHTEDWARAIQQVSGQ